MTGKRIRLWLFLAVIAAAGTLVYQTTVVTLRLPRRGDRLVSAALVSRRNPPMVRVDYRHSVELTPVVGLFKVGPEGLLAHQTRISSTGTGLPNDESARTRREGEWLVVDEGDRPVEFRFFYQPINRLKIAVGDENLPLTGIRPGDVLCLDRERILFWRWLAWRIAGQPWPPEND